jgi:hypothetical protein
MAVYSVMLRLFAPIATSVACVCAGATAGPIAFASEFDWPLLE